MSVYSFTTLSIEPLSSEPLSQQVFRVRLKPLENLFAFKGGQYLFLQMSDNLKIPLSIASPPEQKQFIELHIGVSLENSLAEQMLDFFAQKKPLQIEAPFGDCFLKDSKNHIVVIAGGTGFAPMKSLIESAFKQNIGRPLSLYLGARTQADLYQTALIESWETGAVAFRYVPVINQQETDWQGATGFPHQVALADLPSVKNCDFYIGGSEAMVMNVYHDLLAAGVNKENIFSDMLDIKRKN